MTSSRYQLGNEWEQARERLRALERIHDPISISRLEQIGVGAGWHCLELGPGGGSITEWLCERVGPTGSVVAIDLDPRFVEVLERPNLEVRAEDIVEAPLAKSSYGLVFTRLTLQHIAKAVRLAALNQRPDEDAIHPVSGADIGVVALRTQRLLQAFRTRAIG